MDDRERIAWGLLHALRVPARAVIPILAAGGPEEVLARGLATVRGLERHRAPPIDLPVVRARLASFLADGGRILGGAARDELGLMDRAPSPPLCVYGRGAGALLARRAVAVVGTRAPTPAGAERARAIAGALARAGLVVVSGGARGIDVAAHEGALEHGATVAVLGETLLDALDPRPERLRARFERAGARALAVTPSGPAVMPARGHFVSRNRFVAGLVEAVIVVEAGTTSGTLHTVEAAERIGVPLYVVPPRCATPQTAGIEALLACDRAAPLDDAEQLAAALLAAPAPVRPTTAGLAARAPRRSAPQGARARPRRARRVAAEQSSLFPPRAPAPPLPDDDVVRALAAHGGRMERDALGRASGLTASALASRLTMLELDGVVDRAGAVIALRLPHDGGSGAGPR